MMHAPRHLSTTNLVIIAFDDSNDMALWPKLWDGWQALMVA